MKQLGIYLIFCSLLAFTSCRKKEVPLQETNTPEFSAAFNVGSENVLLEAGNNDYYMFASNYYDSVIGINVFKGQLKQKNCGAACWYNLSILINDVRPAAKGTAMQVDTALMKGQHFYNDISTDPFYYKASFVPEKPFTSSSTYSWTVDDGQTKLGFNSYSCAVQLDARKKYQITLKYDDGVGGCNSSHTNEFRIGNSLQTEVMVSREASVTDLIYSFSAKSSGMAPYKYLWDFGDGTALSTEANPKHTYALSGLPYRASLLLVDACGDTCVAYHQLPASLESNCHANFKASFKPVNNPAVKATVTLLLTDANGKVYTTRNFMQPATSRFDIVSEPENYWELNSLGERTKKVKATFNCVLKNGSQSITISNGNAVFAVSYK
ncbi:MAG: PKD domain-containing protein [Bacteroidia bacterium]|nr:PKD domain-containing protein [Bacteroidia bacterium]